MNSNDIKKGMKVRFKDGHEATVMDNKKGQIRDVEIEILGGTQGKECGSSYVKDWVYVQVGGLWQKIERTNKQKRDARRIQAFDDLFSGGS